MIPPTGLRRAPIERPSPERPYPQPQTPPANAELQNNLVNAANRGGNDVQSRIAQRVQQLVQEKFGGNWQKAFDHYAGGRGKEVTQAGIQRMLNDAGVTVLNGFPPQSMVASRMMDQFDRNRNGGVSWQEFQGGLNGLGVRI
ncbi:MAG: hypothetical protein JNK82_31825 [Myxococcaceae bacterium]|nr:hypothetical protein [Myxococcaceae bacterium]